MRALPSPAALGRDRPDAANQLLGLVVRLQLLRAHHGLAGPHRPDRRQLLNRILTRWHAGSLHLRRVTPAVRIEPALDLRLMLRQRLVGDCPDADARDGECRHSAEMATAGPGCESAQYPESLIGETRL